MPDMPLDPTNLPFQRARVTAERPESGDQRVTLKAESILIEEPQEWERELGRARRALARGRFDRAYAIAEELPPDSVLRQTPEFGEIRYRYVQSTSTTASAPSGRATRTERARKRRSC